MILQSMSYIETIFRFNWISNLGGLVGLCVGGSLITVVEVIWCGSKIIMETLKKKHF